MAMAILIYFVNLVFFRRQSGQLATGLLDRKENPFFV
jgi:hypothetical protein